MNRPASRPDWLVALRAEHAERLRLVRELAEQGLAPSDSPGDVRAQLKWEREHAEPYRARYERGRPGDGAQARPYVPLGNGLSPAGQEAARRRHMDWLDTQIGDERTTPERRFQFVRVRGMLSQRAGDLVGALLSRAREIRQSPRGRERRARRSGPSSRDGPDEPPDDLGNRAPGGGPRDP